jgi:glutathione S-transferase
MFLATLNNRLTQHAYLLDDRISLADMAILPFVRQFAHVDRVWFYASPYRELLHWLTDLLDTPLFASVMKK